MRYHILTEEILQSAARKARELGHSYVGTEHLLLGLLGLEGGGAKETLEELGIDRQRVRSAAVRTVGMGVPGAAPSHGLTPRARRAIEYGAGEALRCGSGYVDTEHLLLGLIREGDNMAVRILRQEGVDHLYMIIPFLPIVRMARREIILRRYSMITTVRRSPGFRGATVPIREKKLTVVAAAVPDPQVTESMEALA